MPTLTVPADVFIYYDSLPADLNTIKVVNGYANDVESVVFPPYPPYYPSLLDDAKHKQLLVWADSEVGGADHGNHGELQPRLKVLIVGVLRQDADEQDSKTAVKDLAIFSNDVRRVMMGNTNRNHPAYPGDENTWGAGTTEDGGIEFMQHLDPQNLLVWVFFSTWLITCRWKLPKGF